MRSELKKYLSIELDKMMKEPRALSFLDRNHRTISKSV